MIGNILNSLHRFLHGLHNCKGSIFLAVKKLFSIKVENLVAIKVFNIMLRPLCQSYCISSQ